MSNVEHLVIIIIIIIIIIKRERMAERIYYKLKH